MSLLRSRPLPVAGSTVQPPHPPLLKYYDDETHRSPWVRGIFNRTARDYDRLESIVGLGTGAWYRRFALRGAGLQPQMTVLDIGTGTGLLARAAARIVGDAAKITGVDPSPGMLGACQGARRRASPGRQRRSHPGCRLLRGLPLHGLCTAPHQ